MPATGDREGRGGHRAIYDSSTARLVSDFFQEDFEAFGYSNRL